LSRKIVEMRLGRSRARAGVVVLATASTALCAAAGVAFGQTGADATTTTTTTATTTTTTTTPEATGDPTSSGTTDTATAGGGTGGDRTGGGSGAMRLVGEAAHPGKAFIYGDRRIAYSFTVDGDRAKDLKIQAVRRSNWKTVKVWRRDNVKPGTHKVRWNGVTRDGKVASKGVYLFRVRTMRDTDLDRSRAKGDDRSVKLYPAKFPVRGRHTYGDGFGAARSGHTHQGQDVFAKCGTPLVAARGGRVQYSGYQAGGAGYYVVIDGRRDKHDYVYMHLKRRGPRKGSRVRTGERFSRVGQTGNASGCHLHFEVWSKPGWYEGGHAMRSVTKKLKEWDGWS
jgi:murein DD-endopeptidase MepM/ murein hydrolase activator NlpD